MSVSEFRGVAHSTRPWLEFVYDFADMELEDSELVSLEDPNAVQLAVSGEVPFSSPAGAVQIYQLQYQANWRPLISTRQMVRLATGEGAEVVKSLLNFDGFAATTDYIAEHRETIHRFNSVMYRTMADMFGPNQMNELEKQVPFVNAANGSNIDAPAIKFIFEELDPFFTWEAQERVWTDADYALNYVNVYQQQIEKFVADGAIAPGDYDLDELFVAKDFWEEAVELKAQATVLAAEADAAGLTEEKKVLADAGKAWAAKYNFLDAVRFLETALS